MLQFTTIYLLYIYNYSKKPKDQLKSYQIIFLIIVECIKSFLTAYNQFMMFNDHIKACKKIFIVIINPFIRNFSQI